MNDGDIAPVDPPNARALYQGTTLVVPKTAPTMALLMPAKLVSASVSLEPISKRFVSGHDFSRAAQSQLTTALAPARYFPVASASGNVRPSICQEDIAFAALNSRARQASIPIAVNQVVIAENVIDSRLARVVVTR
jgi:hypothetical protein